MRTPPVTGQPRDSRGTAEGLKKEKEGAMNTIMQDGMRVTAANRKAWIEICQCPLSLVGLTVLCESQIQHDKGVRVYRVGV